MARIQFIYLDGHPEIFQEEHILTLSLVPDQMPSFEQFYATLVFMSYQKDQVLIVRNFDEDHRAEYILHFYQVIINLATELSTEKKAKDLFDKLEYLQSKECCSNGRSIAIMHDVKELGAIQISPFLCYDVNNMTMVVIEE